MLPSFAALNVGDKTWIAYIDQAQEIISEHWRPNSYVETLHAVMMLEINLDGSLKDIEVLKSSGEKDFDQHAINAVKLSAPFKKLPGGSRPLKIQYFFDYIYETEDATLKSAVIEEESGTL